MPSTATITAKTGPAIQVTALVLSDVKDFTFAAGKLFVNLNGVVGTKEYDLALAATITLTYVAGNYTLTVA